MYSMRGVTGGGGYDHESRTVIIAIHEARIKKKAFHESRGGPGARWAKKAILRVSRAKMERF